MAAATRVFVPQALTLPSYQISNGVSDLRNGSLTALIAKRNPVRIITAGRSELQRLQCFKTFPAVAHHAVILACLGNAFRIRTRHSQ